MTDYNGWTNRKTWNVALWLGNIEGQTNRWCGATSTMSKSAWVAWIQGEYPITGDGVPLTDESVNWDEIYNTIKADWSE